MKKRFFALLLTVCSALVAVGFSACSLSDYLTQNAQTENAASGNGDSSAAGEGGNGLESSVGEGFGGGNSSNNGSGEETPPDDNGGGGNIQPTPTAGLVYTLSDDETYYIVDEDSLNKITDTKLVIPSVYNNLPVKEIGDYGFMSNDTLIEVNIPASIQAIGTNAFLGCTGVTAITVDENNANYTSVDGNLYTKDGKTLVQYAVGKTATTFSIPDSVETVGEYAVAHCAHLTGVTIPDSVETIEAGAFYNCKKITAFVIPDYIKKIGSGAFSYCERVRSITIGDNANYKSADGNLYSKDGKTLIQYAIGKTASSFAIPEEVQTIGSWAFSGCAVLSDVTIPDGVHTVESGAFDGCTNLIQEENGISYVEKWAILGDARSSSATLRADTKGIANRAFFWCFYLTEIVIPDGVQVIGEGAFQGCIELTKVTMGSGVKRIGANAFHSCNELENVTFASPNGWSLSGKWNVAAGTEIPAVELSNAATAAEYLTNSYYYLDCVWTKN